MREILVDATGDEDRSIQAQPGDCVVVRLPENPTTGYRWEAEASAAVEALEPRFHAPTAGPLGAGGEREFAFVVSAPGEVCFRHRRAWEAAGPPRFRLEIHTR